jgi:hypothetical protein
VTVENFDVAATLAENLASTAEQRRSDTHVCRTVCDGRFEVRTHACGDRVRVWMCDAQSRGGGSQVGEGGTRVCRHRRDRHDAAQP